jgi:predicted nucleotidyltransferase
MSTDSTIAVRNPERFKEWEAVALPGCLHEARTGAVTKEQAINAMRVAVERHYPDCIYAFGHGSSLTGSYKAYSDLDVIVFNPDGSNWEIRHEVVDGFPVEFTTYSMDTVEVMAMLALHIRIPLGLLAWSGEIIVDNKGDAKEFQERMAAMAQQMPLVDRTHDRENTRHILFTTLVDLRKDRGVEVAQAVVLNNYRAYIAGVTLLNNTWQHRSRYFMKNQDLPGAARIAELHSAIAKLMAGDIVSMIDFTEDLIEELGGPLWSGRATSLEVRPEYLPVVRMLLTALSG